MIKRGWIVLILSLSVILVGCGPATVTIARRGEAAPDFTLESLTGEEVRLSDFRGKSVLINFWASWCPPCRVEMPDLQRAYEDLDGELVILAVNMLYQDSLPDVQQFVDDRGLTFPILLDRDGAVAVTYRAATLPTSVFIDPEGRVHLIQVGPMTRGFVESVVKEMR